MEIDQPEKKTPQNYNLVNHIRKETEDYIALMLTYLRSSNQTSGNKYDKKFNDSQYTLIKSQNEFIIQLLINQSEHEAIDYFIMLNHKCEHLMNIINRMK